MIKGLSAASPAACMSLFFPAQNTDQLTVEKQEDTHINQMEQTQKTFKKNTFKAELGSVCGVTTV